MITVNVNDKAIEITNEAKYENMWVYFETEEEKQEFLRNLACDFINNDK